MESKKGFSERKKLIERTIRKLASLTGGKEREIQGRHLYKMGQRLLACEKDRIEQKELLSKASKEKPSKKKKSWAYSGSTIKEISASCTTERPLTFPPHNKRRRRNEEEKKEKKRVVLDATPKSGT